MALTEAQTQALSGTERAISVFSIIGILFIVLTYHFLKSFNKPINRLIFYASFGNLGMNVACLISEGGPAAGPNSSLCQFQAFLIQMFLGVDAFWACCMAWNVYLAFFHKYRACQLRSLDKWYLLGCYGAAFVPALTFLFIDTQKRGRIYGPAILWCWIDIKWDFLRIALLYGIVWVAIVFAFAIYIKAGLVIYRRRDALSGFLNPLNEHPFSGIVTTDIDVTIEHVSSPTHSYKANVFDKDFDQARPQGLEEGNVEMDAYTVNVEANPDGRPRQGSKPEILKMREYTREAARQESTDVGAWLYARVAFLFFLSMLIIWIPSSVNRVYALAHPNDLNFALNYVSALVLPMQGFLNVIVYIITSQTASRELWAALRGKKAMPWRQNALSFSHSGNGKGTAGGFGHKKSRSGSRYAGNDRQGRGMERSESTRSLKKLSGSGGSTSDLNVPIKAHVRVGR
ncbi:MAG: hypothetical protein L6R37_002977 [Teloschistes peruensis]|nr:MAG: hypothetical protein L6R37_002977 [Teloschistes peruensis]